MHYGETPYINSLFCIMDMVIYTLPEFEFLTLYTGHRTLTVTYFVCCDHWVISSGGPVRWDNGGKATCCCTTRRFGPQQ